MTESEWLACTAPEAMVAFLPISGGATDRKLRLFVVACCRRIWHLLTARQKQVISQAERYADGLAEMDTDDPSENSDGIGITLPELAARFAIRGLAEGGLGGVASLCARALSEGGIDLQARTAESTAQASLFRDIRGNPFRPPPALEPSVLKWNDGVVVKLAQAAYDERVMPEGTLDRARLAVLADALEEAGCDDAEILGHLRGPGPCVRGCWVVDLILQK
jgi:hypothetical protein